MRNRTRSEIIPSGANFDKSSVTAEHKSDRCISNENENDSDVVHCLQHARKLQWLSDASDENFAKKIFWHGRKNTFDIMQNISNVKVYCQGLTGAAIIHAHLNSCSC